MSVGGVEPAVVYLSPQAISPLSASHEPIALALAQRPDLAEPAGTTASKNAGKTQHETVKAQVQAQVQAEAVHNKAVVQQQVTPAQQTAVAGVVSAGRVDLYA